MDAPGTVTRCSGPQAQSAAKPIGFVRRIPKGIIKTLNLVDIVAGGDGFGTAHDCGIDPSTGKTTSTQTDRKRSDNGKLVSDGRYHRVEQIPLIDGVFIPRGGRLRPNLTPRATSSQGSPLPTVFRMVASGPGAQSHTTATMASMMTSSRPGWGVLTTRNRRTPYWACMQTKGSPSIWRLFGARIPTRRSCGFAPWRAARGSQTSHSNAMFGYLLMGKCNAATRTWSDNIRFGSILG